MEDSSQMVTTLQTISGTCKAFRAFFAVQNMNVVDSKSNRTVLNNYEVVRVDTHTQSHRSLPLQKVVPEP